MIGFNSIFKPGPTAYVFLGSPLYFVVVFLQVLNPNHCWSLMWMKVKMQVVPI